MNIIERPNLPEKNVKIVLCDSRVEKNIVREINNLGCEAIFVPENEVLQTPVQSHPDMNFFYYDESAFYVSDSLYNNQVLLKVEKHCEKINNRVNVVKLSSEYPFDVLLNAAVVGDYIICNTKTVEKRIISSASKVIHISQGYSKCSIAPVTSESFITDDIGIYNATKNLFDVCLVKRGEIILNGYNYGFIGGCCGKLAKDNLSFYGDLNKFSDKDKIISFCRNYNVYCNSLSESVLYVYGSLIPLIE